MDDKAVTLREPPLECDRMGARLATPVPDAEWIRGDGGENQRGRPRSAPLRAN
jgi:hypothetical protein